MEFAFLIFVVWCLPTPREPSWIRFGDHSGPLSQIQSSPEYFDLPSIIQTVPLGEWEESYGSPVARPLTLHGGLGFPAARDSDGTVSKFAFMTVTVASGASTLG